MNPCSVANTMTSARRVASLKGRREKVARGAGGELTLAIDRLREIPGVVAVFIGLRRRGTRWSAERTLTVQVRRKLRGSQLSSRQRIPKLVAGLRTDVIAVGRPRAHGQVDTTDRIVASYDDLQRKSAISAIAENPDGGILVLGSGHGLLPIDGGSYLSGTFEGRGVGVLEEPTHRGELLSGALGDHLDCGVARFAELASPAAMLGHFFSGAPIPHAIDPALGAHVEHWSSKRGFRVTGRVVGVAATSAPVSLDTDAGILVTYASDAVVVVSGDGVPFSKPGDSGSLVFDEHRRAVGFVIGAGKDPDDPSLTVSFVLCRFDALRTCLGDYFPLFFERNPS